MTSAAPKATLGTSQRKTLYAVTAIAWLSGALWLYFRYFGQIPGPLGAEPHPAQAALLKLHGAAAMAFLVVLGALLPTHVRPGWRHKRQRPSGVLLTALCAWLVATGWALYYLSGELPRAAASWSHSAVGLLLPAFVALHVWLSRRLTRPR